MDYYGKRGRYWITQAPNGEWGIYNDAGMCEEHGFDSREETVQYCKDNEL